MDKLWPSKVAYFHSRKVACEKRVHSRVHTDIVCQMICTSLFSYCNLLPPFVVCHCKSF